MRTLAITFQQPGALELRSLALAAPQNGDVVVDVAWTGISTGTERLLWTGRMPAFPGLGYPLVPGYETVGRVTDVVGRSAHQVGQLVFVPGARCFPDARCLFGGSAGRLVVAGNRAHTVDESLGSSATLLALAATAYHALRTARGDLPDLIVGHGALGRLLARLSVALNPARVAPVVWENNPSRRTGAHGYTVIDASEDTTPSYRCIYDASGELALLDQLVSRLHQGGELVLTGFYAADRISFAFTPAFMRGARFRISAEWEPSDLAAVTAMANAGTLDLSDLITHDAPVTEAATAYSTAFSDASCVKMILDWREAA